LAFENHEKGKLIRIINVSSFNHLDYSLILLKIELVLLFSKRKQRKIILPLNLFDVISNPKKMIKLKPFSALPDVQLV
jgi:hypothetical protein